MSVIHQEIMTKAYEKWVDGWSQEQFHDSLTPIEKLAVTTGNLNYQVENGGFFQWMDNRYGTPDTVDYLIRQLKQIADPAVEIVCELLVKYKRAQRNYSNDPDWDDADEYHSSRLGELDERYYEINEAFMEAMEQHFAGLVTNV